MVAGPAQLNRRVPRVVVFSGVPGTGKSTLADAIAREIGAPVFNWDWLMAAIRPFDALQRVLDEGDVIDAGDRAFEVLHLPGHSPDSIGLWDAASGVLF